LQSLKFKKAEPTPLEIEIARLHDVLKNMNPYENNYAITLDQLTKLQKLHLETNSKSRVSPDTLAGVAANLTGILLILNYEHAHVFTSKAAAFVWKTIR
jgi:hypothetical protein